MALYESLTAQSTPEQIAAAYKEYTGMVGGDTQAAQEAATNYLTNLGISAPTITQAYQQYLSPVGALAQATSQPAVVQEAPPQKDLASQILESRVGDQYWGGYGYGDKSANAQAMATWLSSSGITDLGQLGVKAQQVTEPVQEIGRSIDGKIVKTRTLPDEGGQITTNYLIIDPATGETTYSYTPPAGYETSTPLYGRVVDDPSAGTFNIVPIDSSQVSIVDGRPVYNLGARPEFYNKETGQSLGDISYGGRGIHYVADEMLPSDFSEIVPNKVYQVGQTFAGEGGTAFNVVFDEQGNPNFFTSYTGSTSDLGTIAPILSFLSVLPTPLQIPAQLANAAIAADQGNELGAILGLIGAGSTYYAGELAGMTTPGAAEAVSGLDLASDVATLGANPAIQIQNTLSNLNTARTGVQIAAALENQDPSALITSLATTAFGRQISNQPIGDTGLTVGEVVKGTQVADLLSKGQFAQAATLAGDLVNSPDLRVAGLGASILQEAQNENPNIGKMIGYATQLGDTVKNAGTTRPAPKGDLGERIYDDTIVQAGADAYVKAKEAGASDEDAMDAANAVTETTKTSYDQGEFEGLDEAIAQRVKDAQVERLVGDYEKTTGKTFDKATPEEVAGLSYAVGRMTPDQLKEASIQDIMKGAPTIVGKDDMGRWVDADGYAYDAYGFKYRPGENTPMLEILIEKPAETGKRLDESIRETSESFNKWLETVPDDKRSIVQQAVSTATGLVGEQVADLGTALANMGFADRYNAAVRIGQALESAGADLEIPQVTQATKNFWNALEKEGSYGEKAVAGAKAIIENPLVLVQVAKEVGQEGLPMLVGGGVYKLLEGAGRLAAVAGVGTDMLLNSMESMGSASRQKYNEEIAKGSSAEEANRLANIDGYKAFWITTATAGAADASMIKGAEKVMDRLTTKAATSYAKEWGEEGFEELAIALATGDSLNEAIAKSLAGSFIGSKTSGTIQAGSDASKLATDIRNDVVQGYKDAGVVSTDGSYRPDTLVKIEDIGTETADGISSVTESISKAAIEDSSIPDAIFNSVGSAIESGADSSVVIDSAVSAATNSGVDSNTAIAAAINAAVNSGVNAGTAADIATNINANINVNTSVDANTTTTVVVDPSTNTTTQIQTDQNTNTQTTTTINSSTNVNTQTTVNSNTNVTTETSVNTNTNVATQVTTDPNTNTETTVTTDPNTNTQTTVIVDTKTNTVVDTNVTVTPPDYSTPVIEVAPPSSEVATPTTTPSTTKASTPGQGVQPPTSLQAYSGDAGLVGAGAMGLPSRFEIDPALLPSKQTQKAIDPIQRVIQAQAELEKTAMMQQIDPRLLNVLQQRAAPEQQVNQQQQFDRDIGALSQLLSGQSQAPANEGNYYSYGSESSIDDILGGRAVGYKQGGYVAPLMAQGGMALPLLAKSGGALSHYEGRENFKEGKHVAGEGDGQSDDIPAWLADGEFVFPADVVSALGNGSTKAGTDKLYEMMHNIRDRARSTGEKDLPPPALKSPLDYLKSHKRSK